LADISTVRAPISLPAARPPSGQPEHDVDGTDGRLNLGGSGFPVVLGVLDGSPQRGGTAGMMRDEPVGGSVEGRHEFGSVQGGKPPGGAGADVVHLPAGAQGVDGEVHGPRDLRQDLGDGGGHEPILVVDHPQHLHRGQPVDPLGSGVALLGG
jgi:hypothetical protein